jgi:hypothetical protein
MDFLFQSIFELLGESGGDVSIEIYCFIFQITGRKEGGEPDFAIFGEAAVYVRDCGGSQFAIVSGRACSRGGNYCLYRPIFEPRYTPTRRARLGIDWTPD